LTVEPTGATGSWPPGVARVAGFLDATGAEARLEEVGADVTTAAGAADAVGCTLGQIVKSLVMLCDGAPVVVLVPGDRRADTGKIAKLTSVRRVTIARPEVVHEVTGFEPGAVAPFPLPAIAEVLMERRLLRYHHVWAGAGSSQHLVRLTPAELVRLSRARVEDIAVDSA
jgi:prolyl-tRNA editing enzyme YbaK/EbsC (Cys-tRNA(Pro) deacylase)